MNELALFAGAGGGILGGKLLGWRTVCAVELNPYARRVLFARQADGCLEPFPIWDDVTTFDGNRWRGSVDVVSGGFPCQDISSAGKGAGLDGARSGLWAEFARIIGEVQPAFVWVENSPMLLVRGIDRVLWDLAALGYDARWGVVSAENAGAPHKRDRIWIVATRWEFLAYSDSSSSKIKSRKNEDTTGDGQTDETPGWWRISGQPRSNGSCKNGFSGAHSLHEQRLEPSLPHAQERSEQGQRSAGSQRNGVTWWLTEPALGRVANGVADRVDRLKAIGNGQVPAVVRIAWNLSSGG